MTQLIRDFHEHPQSVGETYAGHWLVAMSFALSLLACALVCTVHAFVPGLFKHTASRAIGRLHERMVRQRRRSA